MSELVKRTQYKSQHHILVVDDDERIRHLVIRFLQDHGYVVAEADCGQAAKDLMAYFSFDALVLDVMMPGQTGFELTHDLREQGNDVAIILLTALGEVDNRIEGFESGADDYLPKPFDPRELHMRLQSVLRRREIQKQQQQTDGLEFSLGQYKFNPRTNMLENEAGSIDLTDSDTNLLKAMAENSGRVMTREELAEICGGDATGRSIDVQVTRLRRKIEDDSKTPKYLQTVRGKGYILRVDE